MKWKAPLLLFEKNGVDSTEQLAVGEAGASFMLITRFFIQSVVHLDKNKNCRFNLHSQWFNNT